MLPTPDISHLASADYQNVYEPAEDSFVLLDALEKEAEYLKNLGPSVCLEVGLGSGICVTFLGQLLGSGCLYVGTDINPQAAKVSHQTAQRNGVSLEPVITDLVSALSPRLHGCVDVMIFNPPYVVTPSEEVGGTGIEASWAGGIKGREVTDRLLPDVNKLLSPGGAFYLLIIKENDKGGAFYLLIIKENDKGWCSVCYYLKLLSPGGAFYLLIIKENDKDDLARVMKSSGFSTTVVLSRRSGPEFLSVLKFVRHSSPKAPDG
ncbi:methyltransferase N6AMT1-like isoform X2 [Liolophura sinensis]|uniref:methyltransferase N6AMT1-like isoform X2 n=1 Tax=Liolophura sinensis TaxID=3198878 RepID=UPI0031599558